jgi:hypothetical protein
MLFAKHFFLEFLLMEYFEEEEEDEVFEREVIQFA